MLIYAAGPITGLSYNSAISWREELQSRLGETARVISPMRSKDYLSQELDIASEYDTILSCAKGIVTRDKFDVLRCDIVVVNLFGATKVSIGTMFEMAWAHLTRKPIITIMDENNPHNHPFVNEVTGFMVDSLENAVFVIKSLL